MDTLVQRQDFCRKKEIDWVSPSDVKVTLDDYRNEMYAAERSCDISYEQFKTNMHQWMTRNL